MGVQEGQQVFPACLADGIHALDHHLAQPLAGPHDVGGVHRLVGADQHEPLRPVFQGGVGGFVGADHVVLDRLIGAGLHQGYMLVGRRVVDDVRAVLVKDRVDPPAVPHGSDEHLQVQVRVAPPQLLLNLIGVVLINIKDDQPARLMGRDLAAELASDGSASAGHQDGFPLDVLEDLIQVDFDGLPAQQVLHGHRLHLA